MKIIKIAGFCVLLASISACSNQGNNKSAAIKKDSMEVINTTQTQALEERKNNFNKKANEATKKTYQEGLNNIIESNILKSAKNVGDMAPNFTLKNALGKEVSLQSYLQEGPVVLVWYRGGWCPYCNINLNYLQEELANIQAQGANLIALTPEIPDESISTSEKHHLAFEVLSDLGNKVAREYGVVYTLTDEVAQIYNDKFSLNQHNGDNSNELPLAVTYIINTDGKIEYAFLDADYRNRAEPSEITAFLEKMKK